MGGLSERLSDQLTLRRWEDSVFIGVVELKIGIALIVTGIQENLTEIDLHLSIEFLGKYAFWRV